MTRDDMVEVAAAAMYPDWIAIQGSPSETAIRAVIGIIIDALIAAWVIPDPDTTTPEDCSPGVSR